MVTDLLGVLINQPNNQFVEQFYLIIADRGFYVIASDTAVVGEEHIGAIRGDGCEAQEELRLFVNTAGRNRNDTNTMTRVARNRELQALDHIVALVRRSVQQHKCQTNTALFAPTQFLQTSLQSRVHRFRKIASAVRVLLPDEGYRLRQIGCEIVGLGYVLIPFVAVEQGRGADPVASTMNAMSMFVVAGTDAVHSFHTTSSPQRVT